MANPAAQTMILVCESNVNLQSVMHTWLYQMGIMHKQVNTAEEAVATCATQKYDLIIMDMDSQWPSTIQITSGEIATRSIRCIDGPNKFTPIIGWTAQQQDMSSLGINQTLGKPVSRGGVEAVIAKSLGQSLDTSTFQAPPQSDADQFPYDLDNLPLPDFIFNGEPLSKPASVLVVEDCTLTQHVITSLLKELAPHVAQAFDGEQAINMCDSTPYDIIFMDMNMPKVNGLVATQRIRKSGKNTWVPIIAFTSIGSLNDYRRYGVDDMLSKPFSTESLSHIFDKWTEHTRGENGGGGRVQGRMQRLSDAFATAAGIETEIEETRAELKRLKVEKLRLINQELEAEFQGAQVSRS